MSSAFCGRSWSVVAFTYSSSSLQVVARFRPPDEEEQISKALGGGVNVRTFPRQAVRIHEINGKTLARPMLSCVAIGLVVSRSVSHENQKASQERQCLQEMQRLLATPSRAGGAIEFLPEICLDSYRRHMKRTPQRILTSHGSAASTASLPSTLNASANGAAMPGATTMWGAHKVARRRCAASPPVTKRPVEKCAFFDPFSLQKAPRYLVSALRDRLSAQRTTGPNAKPHPNVDSWRHLEHGRASNSASRASDANGFSCGRASM